MISMMIFPFFVTSLGMAGIENGRKLEMNRLEDKNRSHKLKIYVGSSLSILEQKTMKSL